MDAQGVGRGVLIEEMSAMTEQAVAHGVRSQRAHDAWSRLPHGGHDSARLRVQCGRSHHVATVYATDIGLVYVAPVRARAHGSRDRIDEPHGTREPERWFDLLGAGDGLMVDDGLPAWCECGQRTLSRRALTDWLAEGEHRVVVD